MTIDTNWHEPTVIADYGAVQYDQATDPERPWAVRGPDQNGARLVLERFSTQAAAVDAAAKMAVEYERLGHEKDVRVGGLVVTRNPHQDAMNRWVVYVPDPLDGAQEGQSPFNPLVACFTKDDALAWAGQHLAQREIEKAQAHAQGLAESSQQRIDRLQTDIRLIAERLLTEAEERDWCSEYDDIVEELNDRMSHSHLLIRSREVRFEVRTTIEWEGRLPTDDVQRQIHQAMDDHLADLLNEHGVDGYVASTDTHVTEVDD